MLGQRCYCTSVIGMGVSCYDLRGRDIQLLQEGCYSSGVTTGIYNHALCAVSRMNYVAIGAERPYLNNVNLSQWHFS